MTVKKSLGMGLDLLLTAVENGIDEPPNEAILTKARATFYQAADEDENGNIFEAYHLYRQVMDLRKNAASSNLPELGSLVSQSLNNAAIILHDAGMFDMARNFLRKAVEVCPDNLTARENLQIINQMA